MNDQTKQINPSNEDRAERAESIIEYYCELSGSEPETAITDLLADLHHLVAKWPDDYEGTVAEHFARAVMHYEEESNED